MLSEVSGIEFTINDWVTRMEDLPITTRSLEVADKNTGATLSIVQIRQLGQNKIRIDNTDVQLENTFSYYRLLKAKFKNYFAVRKLRMRAFEQEIASVGVKMETDGATYTVGSDKVELSNATGLLPLPDFPAPEEPAPSLAIKAASVQPDVELINLTALNALILIVYLQNYPEHGMKRIVFVKLIGSYSDHISESYYKKSDTKIKMWRRDKSQYGVDSRSIYFNPNRGS